MVRFGGVLFAGVIAWALPTPTTAAEAPDEDSTQLAPVTVSATKIERPVFETPAAVSTISAEEIEAAMPYGYDDVFETVPGVAIQGGPRRIAEEPSIRGFQDEQIILRIDGARQNFNAAHRGRFLLDPDLLARIEVLRGGHSAIYGSGALGGVISLETKDAADYLDDADVFGLRAKLGYQSNGDELSSYLTAFGQSGAFDVLGSVAWRDVGENFEDGAGNDILATQDRLENGLLKLGFELSEHQRLEFSASRYTNTGVNTPNANSEATVDNIVDRNTQRDGYRMRYRFDNPDNRWLQLTAVAYRTETEVDEQRFADDRRDFTDFTTTGFDLYNHTRFEFFGDRDAVLTYGVEGYSDSQSGTRNGELRPEFPTAEADYRAYYFQADLPITAKLSLLPGVRSDSFEYDATGFAKREETETSPRISLGYRASDDLYLWGGYSESFRAPSLTELYADGVHFVAPIGPGQVVINEFQPTPDLAPEYARSEEIGLRYRWGDENEWLLSANAWRSRVDNFVDSVVIFISGPPSFDPSTGNLVFPGTTTNTNTDADLHGFETELRYDAGSWYAEIGASLVDGERRESGEGLGSLQQDRAYLESGLHFNHATIGARVIGAAARDDVPEGSLVTPGYGVVDIFASYTPASGFLDGFELRASVNNVLDREYRVHPSGVNQPGRSVRLSIARTFGGL
ncbi:MAG TPA: TonB-dependent hemoglobin/transferrin/lactoferrin family receptor [Gammaproteobacteria bacterium]